MRKRERERERERERDETAWVSSCVLIAVGLAIAPNAWSSTEIPRSPAEMIALASVIVEGKVAAVGHTLVVVEGEQLPVTVYTLRVSQVLMGAVVGQRIDVVVPGGPMADGRWRHVGGAPHFEMNDHLLVIGEAIAPSRIAIASWHQGAFQLDETTGVARTLDDGVLADLGCSSGLLVARPSPAGPSALGDYPATSELDVRGSAGTLFVDRPTDHGLGWMEVLSATAACAASTGNTGVTLEGR